MGSGSGSGNIGRDHQLQLGEILRVSLVPDTCMSILRRRRARRCRHAGNNLDHTQIRLCFLQEFGLRSAHRSQAPESSDCQVDHQKQNLNRLVAVRAE